MSKRIPAIFRALGAIAIGMAVYLWLQPQSALKRATSVEGSGQTGLALAGEADEVPGTTPFPQSAARPESSRTAVGASNESERLERSNPTSQEPLSELDRRNRHSIRLFKKALRQFRSKPGLASGSKLASKTAVAWGDFSGTSIPYAEGDPIPPETLTEEEWSIWISDPFGSRLVRVFRDELPEFWEVLAIESSSDRAAFDDSLRKDTLDRLAQRAETLLAIMGSQDS